MLSHSISLTAAYEQTHSVILRRADLHKFILGGADCAIVTTQSSMALHVAEKVDLVSKQVAECLGGKGGGRAGRYQGKAPHITQAEVQDAMKRMSQATAARLP